MSRRIGIVDSFDDLINARFEGDINALCWSRSLPGDFGEIVYSLRKDEDITAVTDCTLRKLNLSAAGAQAREVLLEDQALLRDRGLAPTLDCISRYAVDDPSNPIPTDVYSFHVDRATTAADTFLCTYFGSSTEGLLNEAAVRRIDMPDTRAKLRQLYGDSDEAVFSRFLSENCFDLHFCPRSGAQPYSFGIGNLWRIAIAHPDSRVLPCIHRAPLTRPGDTARLLLIS